MNKIGLKVSEAKIGVMSTTQQLLDPKRFYWLDTNFLSVERLPFSEAQDSFLEIWDRDSVSKMTAQANLLRLEGDFSRFEQETQDLRYSIFGNLGIFSSWVLRTLEEKHDIYTLHACGLIKENTFLLIPGGAGSGKSVFIFSALNQGWKVFSTEFVHFRVKESLEFFKGSLKDAVRVDTLKLYFPEIASKLGIDIQEETGSKQVVDLASFQYQDYKLADPDIYLVLPHIEEKRDQVLCQEISDSGRELVLRYLFFSASEKIGKSNLLYGRMPISGLDTLLLAEKRLQNLEHFLNSGSIRKCLSWVSGVKAAREIFNKLEALSI